MKSRGKSSLLPDLELPSLPPEFYLQGVTRVATALLGKGLFVKDESGNVLVAEIVETEAYFQEDPASHSFAGKTKRTWPMFEAGGTCYVYLSYGVNYCMNVVTGLKGTGEAVLLRAARPVLGAGMMRERRKVSREYDLTNGPGKLTQALGIGPRYNGLTFFRADFKLVDLGTRIPGTKIARSPRIGISKAREELLRFYVKDSPWISRKQV